MTTLQIVVSLSVWILLTAIVFTHCQWNKIRDCFGMWFTREYWTNYNIVEAVSWAAKAIIIVPGLIFGIQIWWLYFLTLATSLSLIWASNKKLLPSLVAFNVLWTGISCVVLAQHII